jgi:hypothetical protein
MRFFLLVFFLAVTAILAFPSSAWAPTIITRGTLSAGGFGFATADVPCASQTVNWNTNCSGTSPTLSSGAQTGVSNTAGGYTGSVTVTCNNGDLSQSGASCTATCAGTLIGGYCWYEAASGASCDTTCAGHGGNNSTGTINYAGSGSASGTNCGTIVAAMGHGGSEHEASCGSAVGCVFDGFKPQRCTSPTTTTSATQGGWNRECACNN